jgi:GntR family transcriptional regulator
VRVASGVDPTSDRPVYRQIADQLRAAIEAGELGPGDRLPSESELMRRHDVAQGTVRNALSVLRGEGLILAEHGRGVFVRERPRLRRLAHDRFARRHREAGKAAYLAEAETESVKPSVDVYYVGAENASDDIAHRLGVSQGEKVLARRRRYLSDGRPTELATSYIPWGLAEGTPMMDENPGPGGVYARIEEAGHRLDHFDEEVSARMPTPEEARALRLAAGAPVLTLIRTAYDIDGQAVKVCDTVMSADWYVLNYRLAAD